MIVTWVAIYWFRYRLFTLCLKVCKLFVSSMVSGWLFHKEGPISDKVFCPVIVLRKGCFSFAKTISCVYSKVWSEFKDFIQIKRTVFVGKLGSYCIYALVNSFFRRQLVYQAKLRKRYMLHFIKCKTKPYTFILHNLYLFFFSKIWVPSCARVVKMWLNKRITKHSS